MGKGRPRKPLEQLQALGVFRPDRHLDRLNEPKATGEPIKPADMEAEASAMWDRCLPRLLAQKTVKEIDTELLASACELWSLYCKAKRLAYVDPTDKNIRGAVVAYWAAFNKAASQLGMTPADRAKLSVPPDEKPKDGIEEFARKRG